MLCDESRIRFIVYQRYSTFDHLFTQSFEIDNLREWLLVINMDARADQSYAFFDQLTFSTNFPKFIRTVYYASLADTYSCARCIFVISCSSLRVVKNDEKNVL